MYNYNTEILVDNNWVDMVKVSSSDFLIKNLYSTHPNYENKCSLGRIKETSTKYKEYKNHLVITNIIDKTFYEANFNDVIILPTIDNYDYNNYLFFNTIKKVVKYLHTINPSFGDNVLLVGNTIYTPLIGFFLNKYCKIQFYNQQESSINENIYNFYIQNTQSPRQIDDFIFKPNNQKKYNKVIFFENCEIDVNLIRDAEIYSIVNLTLEIDYQRIGEPKIKWSESQLNEYVINFIKEFELLRFYKHIDIYYKDYNKVFVEVPELIYEIDIFTTIKFNSDFIVDPQILINKKDIHLNAIRNGNHLFNLFLEKLIQLVNDKQSIHIVEIGVGYMYLIEYLSNYIDNFTYTCIDKLYIKENEEIIERLEQKNIKVNYIVGDIYEIEEVINQSNVIIGMNVLDMLDINILKNNCNKLCYFPLTNDKFYLYQKYEQYDCSGAYINSFFPTLIHSNVILLNQLPNKITAKNKVIYTDKDMINYTIQSLEEKSGSVFELVHNDIKSYLQIETFDYLIY